MSLWSASVPWILELNLRSIAHKEKCCDFFSPR